MKKIRSSIRKALGMVLGATIGAVGFTAFNLVLGAPAAATIKSSLTAWAFISITAIAVALIAGGE